jgi:hypothetical protein
MMMFPTRREGVFAILISLLMVGATATTTRSENAATPTVAVAARNSAALCGAHDRVSPRAHASLCKKDKASRKEKRDARRAKRRERKKS